MFLSNTEELAQNKIILLYIINTAPFTFSRIQLNNFVLERNYMNYFFFQQYLSELIDSNFIVIENINESDVIKITKKGLLILEFFEDKVPRKLKSDLEKEFNNLKEKDKIKSQVQADYFPKDNGQYIVNIRLVENGSTLFSLYLDVPTEKEADIVCNKWKENPNEIYSQIMNIFI